MSDIMIRNYIRAVIAESSSNIRRLNSLSKKVTRDIMTLIKTSDLSRDSKVDLGTYSWAASIDTAQNPDEEFEEDFSVTVGILIRDVPEPDVYAHINPDDDFSSYSAIHVNVILPKSLSNEHLGILYRELLEAMRHEIEHLSQDDLPRPVDNEYSIVNYRRSHLGTDRFPTPNAESYYLTEKEVPSFVLGMLAKLRVKTKQGLSDEIRDYLQPKASDNWREKPKSIAKEDVGIIHDAWMDWANRNVKTRSYQGS